MRYRGALEINRQVRDAERQQLLLRASEWSYVARPARSARGLPLRGWLAAVHLAWRWPRLFCAFAW